MKLRTRKEARDRRLARGTVGGVAHHAGLLRHPPNRPRSELRAAILDDILGIRLWARTHTT